VIGGDLDAAPLPAEIYVVWEHLIGVPSRRYTDKRFERYLRLNWQGKALGLWDTNAVAVTELWGLWDDDRPVSLVTYLPDELLGELAVRVKAESIPHRRLIPSTPRAMGTQIALMPDVRRIVHGQPQHALLYGPKGLYVPANAPYRIREALA
jgi:hypothetical protein